MYGQETSLSGFPISPEPADTTAGGCVFGLLLAAPPLLELSAALQLRRCAVHYEHCGGFDWGRWDDAQSLWVTTKPIGGVGESSTGY